eukprot:scaffold142866_cov148-Phaeocystis_antarctica.AAC.1
MWRLAAAAAWARRSSTASAHGLCACRPISTRSTCTRRCGATPVPQPERSPPVAGQSLWWARCSG